MGWDSAVTLPRPWPGWAPVVPIPEASSGGCLGEVHTISGCCFAGDKEGREEQDHLDHCLIITLFIHSVNPCSGLLRARPPCGFLLSSFPLLAAPLPSLRIFGNF